MYLQEVLYLFLEVPQAFLGFAGAAFGAGLATSTTLRCFHHSSFAEPRLCFGLNFFVSIF
jgi:hypothetical protein